MNIVEFMDKANNFNVVTNVTLSPNGALITITPSDEPIASHYVSWMPYTYRGDYEGGIGCLENYLDESYTTGVEKKYFRREENE